jgi:hypothetical protein
MSVPTVISPEIFFRHEERLQFCVYYLAPTVGAVDRVYTMGTIDGTVHRIFGEKGDTECLVSTATKAATAFGLFAFGLAHVKKVKLLSSEKGGYS